MNVPSLAVPFALIVLAQAAPPQGAGSKPAAADASAPFKVATTFAIGGEGGWDYVAIDPEARRLYVTRSTHVTVLDADRGTPVGDIPNTEGVHGVALAPDLGRGFSSNGRANSVTAFDLKTLKPIQTVTTGTNPDSIVFEPVTKRVFAFNGRSQNATVIGAEDLAVAGTIALGGKPEFSVIDGKGKVFVNLEDTSEVARIDAKTLAVEQRWSIAPGEEPSGLAIDVAHRRLFSACGNGKMVVSDADAGKVVANVAIGQGTDGAGFDVAGGFAFSSNGDGTLSVVAAHDGATFGAAQTLTTQPGARTMVVDPKTRRIFLPTAEFEPPPAGETGRRRPPMKPDSFKIVVVEPSAAKQ